MKVWILKAVIQKTISFLPFKNKVNFLFQKYVTKGLTLTDELFNDKLYHCNKHVQAFAKYSGKPNYTSLEIGTGWYPIVPFGLYLCGAGKIYSVDISSLTNHAFFITTLKKYSDYHHSGELAKHLPGYDRAKMDLFEDLLRSNAPLEEIKTKLNLHFTVQDARSTNFTTGYFDLINSNNTFEHIYPDILEGILKEFNRILATDGVMSHNVDMSDHFAHLDKSITIYNFLQYSDAQWSRIDNSIQPQSRARISDYLAMLKRTGFKLIEQTNRTGKPEQLTGITLDAKYAGYKQEDILVSHTELVLKK